jgi:tetratricopeptide (TPR) repeat protein
MHYQPILFLFSILSFSGMGYAQADRNNGAGKSPEANEIMKKIGSDSTSLLNNVGHSACNCIDSVNKSESDKKKKMDGISNCIDQEVNAYQLALKLMKSMKAVGGNWDISINSDKNSDEYKKYYYRIENWLLDSCRQLKRAIATNDDQSEKSFSGNPAAMAAYNAGIPYLEKNQYAEALPWFEKAVSIDSVFAFAWDNLGICYRRTNQLEKAAEAYKTSLRIDPYGKTPLQNLPIVYMLLKRDDQAIDAYKKLLLFYPEDPEVYYGLALVYYNNKNDMENALRNVCKAYTIYLQQKSPYRSDAEKVINMIYSVMKKDNQEELFRAILKENNIRSN